jgi:hypothetical protein
MYVSLHGELERFPEVLLALGDRLHPRRAVNCGGGELTCWTYDPQPVMPSPRWIGLLWMAFNSQDSITGSVHAGYRRVSPDVAEGMRNEVLATLHYAIVKANKDNWSMLEDIWGGKRGGHSVPEAVEIKTSILAGHIGAEK